MEIAENERDPRHAHRLVAPAQTLEAVQRFFPVMGITRVADITGLDTIGIPVIAVCRPNSRSVVVSLGVDLTREEFGIAVVRVIVPGLEGPTGLVSCLLGRRAMSLIGSR